MNDNIWTESFKDAKRKTLDEIDALRGCVSGQTLYEAESPVSEIMKLDLVSLEVRKIILEVFNGIHG